ncbi:hypothetical protein [Kitasatospora sp. NPDC091276]|uniref:hypothetical protein n=1 Tax=Kitasatospora sp. NPDC091276 TaxID=3155300 RepID=UPI00344671FC
MPTGRWTHAIAVNVERLPLGLVREFRLWLNFRGLRTVSDDLAMLLALESCPEFASGRVVVADSAGPWMI